jgi:large subunit ribosomal protein L7/L12
MASEKIEKILDDIAALTLLEAKELADEMEEKFGVTAAAPMAGMMMAAPGEGAAVEEQTEFDVMLMSPGSQKIKAIKVVREITSLGLKEAKELVDNAPKAVKEAVTKEEAEEVKAKLEEVGAVVEVK